LHPRLRRDPRVISLERTDIRDLETLPGNELVDLIVVDVSFISLRLVLPTLLRFLRASGQMVILIKPQFEAGPEAVSRGGVVRGAQDRHRVLEEVLGFVRDLGLVVECFCQAPPDAHRANVEYLAWLRRSGPGRPLG
jgi:23S rRNA (cytidine1920-2'-O)/16S rRNA (cytidine1409-2'-O)-methyltransferase